jgi:small nuclear ribonucleoprotein (snRNP)-like protein
MTTKTWVHFGVQMRGSLETVSNAANLILKTASTANIIFDTLEVLDTITLGTTRFARCRADIPNIKRVLDSIFITGRGVIVPDDVYQVRFPNGRVGPVPHSTMQAVARLPKTFRGTSSPHWRRQFPNDAA